MIIGLGFEKYLNYLTGLGLILLYIAVRLEKQWELFYYNQAGMLLENHENLLELSVKQ